MIKLDKLSYIAVILLVLLRSLISFLSLQITIPSFIYPINDTLIMLFLIIILYFNYKKSAFWSFFFRKNRSLVILTLLCLVSALVFYLSQMVLLAYLEQILLLLLALRCFYALGIGPFKKPGRILQELSRYPARNILLSFLGVILAGAFLLSLPIATSSGAGLNPLDALFTATSAVCVTGLIVVDTATVFTLFGQIIILILIQIGGLGIMVFSFFVLFLLNRRFSLKNKLLISYMLSEDDMGQLFFSLQKILLITFAIEGCGALLLFWHFFCAGYSLEKALLFGIFHSVSAFCNAGFALFTDSMESWLASPRLNIILCTLIVCGAISFTALSGLWRKIKSVLRSLIHNAPANKLALNNWIALTGSAFLIICGIFLFYALEHGNSLRDLPLASQYWSSLFQSVTLRTAGFNTLPIGSLLPSTLFFMIIFMFIGGASGSTAGGVKVNTIAVVLIYLKNLLQGKENIVIHNSSIPKQLVFRAFLVLSFALIVISSGVFVLLIVETAPLIQLLFEAVSAFCTVGLSTGITASLSIPGKIVIILLMFMGRLGAITVLAAFSDRDRQLRIEYPEEEIAVG